MVMSRWTLRILGYVALALAAFAVADGAEAGVGDRSAGALSSFGRLSPVQTVQFGGGNCYYADGWNGHGWYQCGNEWNDGFGWIGPFNLNTFGGSAIRRHHHGVVVSHPPALNPVSPRLEPPRRLGARGAPAFHTFGGASGLHRYGAGGVPTSPNFRAGAATVSPGFAGGGFHGGLGGNFHHFHGAGVPHIGAPVSPGFAGGNGFRGLGGAAGVHIGAPASPSFAGAGTFHAGGGGIGAPRIGAPASPGFAGGGFHGVGGGGVFQGVGAAFGQGGGAAFGQGGIGHR
jgi:hypothetical protein